MARARRLARFALGMLGPVLSAALSIDAFAQQSIPGYFDLKTRTFTALPVPPPPFGSARLVTTQGTLIIEIAASIDPSVPPDAFVNVVANLTVSDGGRTGSVGTQAVLRRTGNNGKASLRLPYLVATSSRSVPMNITVQLATPGTPHTPFARLSQTIPLPADGATTTVQFSASL